MMFPLTPILRALAQITHPVLLGVVARSLLLAALAFLGLVPATSWLLHALANWLLGTAPWWGAGLLGGILSALAAYFLYLPVAAVVAALFCDQVAAAVEQDSYPGLAPARGATWTVQGWDALALGAKVLVAQFAALLGAVLLPGLGLVLGWAIGAWALGRGLFMAVAMRRCTRPEALALYAGSRWLIWLQGGLLTAAALLPVLNLLVPVVGVAAMVHVFHRRRPEGSRAVGRDAAGPGTVV
jgi:CysZ protein